MKIPTWFIPLSEALATLLTHGAALNTERLSRYEVAAILYLLQLSKAVTSSFPPIEMERKFSKLLEINSDDLKAALTKTYNQTTFVAGLAKAAGLGIGLVDKESIRRHAFIHPDGSWNFNFAQDHLRVFGAKRHEHARSGGPSILLSDHQLRLIHTIRANQKDSIEAQAHAGTGKTFVLEEIMALMPDRRFIFMADAEPKLKNIRKRFPQVIACTFKSMAERLLSQGNRFIAERMSNESRYFPSYTQLAEQAGLSAIGNRSAAHVASMCWKVIFRFCMSKDPSITTRHIPRAQIHGLTHADQEVLAAVAANLWNRMTLPELEAPMLPVRGYHRIKQMSLKRLYVPEEYDTVLIDESHDLSGPMVELLDNSPQTVISLGDQFQNLDGEYAPHKAMIRHREMATSLRAGPPLVGYINPLIEMYPDASTLPFTADRAREMAVSNYPALQFPPEPTVIVVANEWGIFDWLIRNREMNQGAAIIDWEHKIQAFLNDCLELFKYDTRPSHGAIAEFRNWNQLHEELKWNPAFLRVEKWLGTVGIQFGVSGLYQYANIKELSNHSLARPLIATIFTVKNYELRRMAISEDLYYHPTLYSKKQLSKKLAGLYTAFTRASGKIYFPDTHHDWMAQIDQAARLLKNRRN